LYQDKRKEANKVHEKLWLKYARFEKRILSVTNCVLKFVHCLTGAKKNAEHVQVANAIFQRKKISWRLQASEE
jgi:hypothetical protein